MEETDATQRQNVDSLQKEEKTSQKDVTKEAYFFHPVQLSEESGQIIDEKEIEKSNIEIEQKLQELLRSISEETLQLNEFLTRENELMNDICISIKQVLQRINVSFNIPPHDIPGKRKAKRIILNKECHLTLVYQKGQVRSAFLAQYPPEIVMAVLWIIMPELARAIMRYRKKISKRVSLFEKVKMELKNITKAMVGGKEAAKSTEENVNAIEHSLKTEK